MTLRERHGPARLTAASVGLAALVGLWIPLALAAVAQWLHDDACPYRISTSGRIHGPDSPYRAMTAPTRCFETRAAAEAALRED